MQVHGRGVMLEVDDAGEGEPALLFIHSLGGRIGFWKPVLREVRRLHRAVAFDLRGHGGSETTPEAGWALEQFVNDALAVADASSLDRFVLVGHSFGALVALALAARAPRRVRMLVLVDPAGSFAEVPAEALAEFAQQIEGEGGAGIVREAYAANLGRARPGTRAAVLASLAATPREAVAAGYRAQFAADPAALLAAYGGPVRLIVDEENDSPYSLRAQRPDLAAQPIADVSHWLQLDEPDAFNAALDTILTSLEGE
jgi:pimeloyl-ACP methyl ester carboxylesterase